MNPPRARGSSLCSSPCRGPRHLDAHLTSRRTDAPAAPPAHRRRRGAHDRRHGPRDVIDRATYEAAELTIEPGDLLVACSDGVTEAESPAGGPFDEVGLRGLIETHHGGGLDDLGEAIVSGVVAHADSARLADDLTVLAARRLPPVSDDA